MSTRHSSLTPRSTAVRVSTRGTAANNSAVATSAASTASSAAAAAPRTSGRSTPTTSAPAPAAAAAAASSSASSLKRKRDADARAADSPTVVAAAADAAAPSAAASAAASAAVPDVLLDARSALTTLETIPLCFTSPLYRQGKIIRLTRVHTHATAEAAAAYAQAAKSAAAASAASAAAASSSAAAAAASSTCSSPLSSLCCPPETTSYIRASDLAQLFLSSKNAVSAYVASFSSPMEKVLMRVPGQRTGGDVLLFTRKGLKRALLTRQLRADVSLSRWVQEILLDGVMAHGSKGLIIPAEAMRPPRSANDMEDIAEDDPDEGEAKQQSEEEMAAARKKRMLALPRPTAATLAAWVAASLSTASALHKADSERETKLAAIAAASPAQQRGGSSAGKNWAGHAFADKRTRVGLKFQAMVPDKLSYAQQKANLSVDDPRFATEELIYSPSLPQPRWAPFVDWPRVRPDDPASRKHARAAWDAEQLEARRSTRRMDGADPGDGVLSMVTGSLAQRFERELAAMQREERTRVEAKLLRSAFRQLNRVDIKQDRGLRDFEPVFLGSFHEWGSIERIFLFDLPQPGRDLQEEAFEVTAARFVPVAMWTEARDRDARDAAARAAAKRRRMDDGSAGGSISTHAVTAPSAAAASAAAASASTAPAAASSSSSSASAGVAKIDRDRNAAHLNGQLSRVPLPPSLSSSAAALPPPPAPSSAAPSAGLRSPSGLHVPAATATRGLLQLSLPQTPPTPRTAATAAAASALSAPSASLSAAARPPPPHAPQRPVSLQSPAAGSALSVGLSPSASLARPPPLSSSPPSSSSSLLVRLPSVPPQSKAPQLHSLGLRASLAPPPPSIAQMQQKQQAKQHTITSR